MLVQQVNEGVEVVGLDELSHVLRDQVGEAVHSLPHLYDVAKLHKCSRLVIDERVFVALLGPPVEQEFVPKLDNQIRFPRLSIGGL